MPKSKLSKQLDQFRRLAVSRDTAGFAAQLRLVLEDDFSLWFRELRIQKLATQFRSVPHITDVRRLLLSSEPKPSFSYAEFSKLDHHFSVCEFIQQLFTHIDTETAALPCCTAHPEVIARTVVRMLEMANYVTQKNITADAIAAGGLTSLQVSGMARKFRDLLDTGNTILNSQVARAGEERNYKISDAEIDKLVRLAFAYDEVRQVFDLYSYQNAEIRIKRRSLVLKNTAGEAELAAAVGAERTSDFDQARHVILNMLEVKVHGECRSIARDSSRRFIDFLRNLSGEARERVGEYYRALQNELEHEVGGFFDLGASLRTELGEFTVNELINAWTFIATLAMLGQKWSDRFVEAEGNHPEGRMLRNVPIPELNRNWFLRIMARETNTSRVKANDLLNQFTSRSATGRIDLFYKPLLLMSNTILLPTAYIRNSRFERNIFTLIASESDLDQKKKGYLPVRELKGLFVEAGFRSLTDFRVRINRQEITDIDLVAFKDGLLFLAQSKIVIDPDSQYDAWKAEEKLNWAAVQLGKCLAQLDTIRESLFERLGLRGVQERRVVPFIVTNSRQFTERRFREHPVVDVPYLRFLLSGAQGTIIGVGSGRIGAASGHSYIKGQRPTGEELEELLRRTIHRVMKREMVSRYEMKTIGDRKIHVPMGGLKTPGEGRMVFTDKEIFGKG